MGECLVVSSAFSQSFCVLTQLIQRFPFLIFAPGVASNSSGSHSITMWWSKIQPWWHQGRWEEFRVVCGLQSRAWSRPCSGLKAPFVYTEQISSLTRFFGGHGKRGDYLGFLGICGGGGWDGGTVTCLLHLPVFNTLTYPLLLPTWFAWLRSTKWRQGLPTLVSQASLGNCFFSLQLCSSALLWGLCFFSQLEVRVGWRFGGGRGTL